MKQQLMDAANAMMAGDKDLLAMDESHPTCHKRFAKLDIPQTVEMRQAYREMIVTTPGPGDLAGRGIQHAGGATGAAASRSMQPRGAENIPPQWNTKSHPNKAVITARLAKLAGG